MTSEVRWMAACAALDVDRQMYEILVVDSTGDQIIVGDSALSSDGDDGTG
jgi:hypothetical protein